MNSLFRHLTLLFFFVASFCFAQQNKVDSLRFETGKKPDDRELRKKYSYALRKLNADSAVNLFISWGNAAEEKQDLSAAGDWYYYAANTFDQLQKNTESEEYFQKSVKLLKSVRDTFNLDDCQNSYGYLLLRTGKYKESMTQLREALAYREYVNDTAGKAGVLLHLGLLYNNMGDYTLALENYFECIEYLEMERERDASMMGKVYNNIGAVYMNQKKYEDALRFYRQAVTWKTKAGNKKDLASTYNNIGSVYMEINQDSALYYFNMSLKLREESNDLRGQGIVHKNISEIHYRKGNYKEAERELNLSLEFREKVNDRVGIASTLIGLGKVYRETGRKEKALPVLLRADSLAHQTGSMTYQLDAAIELSNIYSDLGQLAKALEYSKFALSIKDSIYNDASTRHSEEMKARYDMEQQSKELEALKMKQRENELMLEAERNFYKLLIGAGIVILILVVGFFVIRQRENSKAQSRLQFAYDQIETKNKDITDSIRYAKRIQQAILPDDELLKQVFPESFTFYRPKDIVSGDFYWFHQNGNQKLIAVADCTGHGVPGAFMSVLGASQLTSVTAEKGMISPAEILKSIDNGIRQQLHQDGVSGMKDSMDIAVCSFDTESRKLTFAGANRPLVLFRNSGQLEIHRPQKVSVGGDTEDEKQFEDQVLQLMPGDMFYMFTDGFADQFGGPKGKKFKTSRLKELLLQMASQDVSAQKRELELVFDSWKGQFEQVDDICVVGIRV